MNVGLSTKELPSTAVEFLPLKQRLFLIQIKSAILAGSIVTGPYYKETKYSRKWKRNEICYEAKLHTFVNIVVPRKYGNVIP